MKFLIVSSEYPPQVGGAGSYIHDLANGLVNQGHYVEIVTRKFNDFSQGTDQNNLKVHHVRNIPKIFILSMWWKIKKIYCNDFDYILLNDVGATFVATLFFNIQMKSKSVCFFHGQEDSDIINKKLNLIESLLFLKEKYFRLLDHCKMLIAVSEDQKNKIIKACQKKIDLRDKFKVVFNSFNSDHFFYNKNILPDFDHDQINIISVSRIVKQKGYDLKFKIMSILSKKNINFHWYIIGDGNYKDEFEYKIRNSTIKDKTTFLGKINRNELRKYYSNADLFILLSEFRESFGLVYLEAMACGCPAIGLDNGGVREVIRNSVNGYLINNSTRKDQIIEETVKYIELNSKEPLGRNNIIHSVNKFDNEVVVNDFLELFR